MALKVAIFMTLHSHLYFFLALFLIPEKTQPVNTPGFRRLQAMNRSKIHVQTTPPTRRGVYT